jgi:hypothetical protein
LLKKPFSKNYKSIREQRANALVGLFNRTFAAY